MYVGFALCVVFVLVEVLATAVVCGVSLLVRVVLGVLASACGLFDVVDPSKAGCLPFA